MVKVSYTIKSEEGLHARPASDFCKTAASFRSHITVRKDRDEYNAKSILMVLSMGAEQGEEIEICAEGEDEQAAIDALIQILDME